jgi:hypothetical protein
VPALAFYSDRSEFLAAHLETAYAAFQLISAERSTQAAAAGANAALLTVLGVSDIQAIIQLLAAGTQPGNGKKGPDNNRTRPSTHAEAEQIGAAN